ncbi:hypothetical protein IAU59_006784 [Kwoniella sp. CBS 9459]
MSFFQAGEAPTPPVDPITGAAYLVKLHKYLQANASRLSPSPPPPTGRSASTSGTAGSILQQSYTLLTLGLDPNSAPLSRSLKVPLTLGFGTPSSAPSSGHPGRLPSSRPIRPLLLRLPPDRLLYLLLRWQSLPQNLPHVGRTDVPIEDGVPVAARGARLDERAPGMEGDVRSVRSWVGSMRSVSMGSLVGKEGGRGWFGRKEEINEDQILLALYSMFTLLPALLIHPPFVSEPPILELIEAGGYTQLGGIDVRVPLDVLRNLSILELEGYDPRALLIPYNLNLRSLTVKDVQDGDDWIEELLTLALETEPDSDSNRAGSSDVDDNDTAVNERTERKPRFPNLRYLSLMRTNLLSLPTLPLTSLTHLDLSHNLLNSIPSSLAGLTSLTSLNLSNNVITSLRSAETSLPSIVSLNLSSNRIDCLVGLDRIPTLQRVDVRRNELLEVGEVGRLAVLPRIKEVWCSGNGFDIAGEDEWRVELGAAFKEEGRDVIVDDSDFSWSESRRIDALLASRGRTGGRVWNQASSHHPHPHAHQLDSEETNVPGASSRSISRSTAAPTASLRNAVHPSASGTESIMNSSQAPVAADSSAQSHSRQSSTRSQLGPSTSTRAAGAAASTSPGGGVASPASSAAVAKKKGRRRVIHLDSSETVNAASGDLNVALALGSGGDASGLGLGSVRSLGAAEGKGSMRGLGGSVRLPGKVVEDAQAEAEAEAVKAEAEIEGDNVGSELLAKKASTLSDNGILPPHEPQSSLGSSNSHEIATGPNTAKNGKIVTGTDGVIESAQSDGLTKQARNGTRNKHENDSGSARNGSADKDVQDIIPSPADPPSVKVVSSKRRNNRKALKKDTFRPIT